jgi:hypothetical protein
MELTEVTIRRLSGILGQRFGRLVVEAMTDRTHRGARLYRCLCDCGELTTTTKARLVHRTKKSCGCLGKELRQSLGNYNRQDLCGKHFGGWRVLSRMLNPSHPHTFYTCSCECGQVGNVRADTLKSGGSTSCGCYAKEIASERFKKLKPVRFRWDRR